MGKIVHYGGVESVFQPAPISTERFLFHVLQMQKKKKNLL